MAPTLALRFLTLLIFFLTNDRGIDARDLKVELRHQKQVDSNKPYRATQPNYIASYTTTKHKNHLSHQAKLSEPYITGYRTSNDAYEANQPNYITAYGGAHEANQPNYITAYGTHETSQPNYITGYRGAHEANQPIYITGYSGANEAKKPNYITAYGGAHETNQPNYITAYGGANEAKKPNYITAYGGPNEAKTPNYITAYGGAHEINQPSYITAYGSAHEPNQPNYITAYGGANGAKKRNYITAYGGAHEVNQPSYITAYGTHDEANKGPPSPNLEDSKGPQSPNVDHTEAFKTGFFTLDDLYAGNVMTLQFPIQEVSHFLSRKEADSIPLSMSQLPSVLQLFSILEDSPQAKSMRDSLEQCEAEPIAGETKICANSLESMLEFVDTIIGFKHIILTTSHPSPSAVPLQKYTILEVSHDINAPKWVACHPLPYPYAIHFCHFIATGTKVFKVSLVGENGDKMEALGICHLDTSEWNPNHILFRQLGIKPGKAPVCHFFPAKHLLWVPQPSTATM